jgi:hypothetical protein
VRFYAGLDEATALLLQPYTHVTLWHVFDESFEEDAVRRKVVTHVEKLLKFLPLGYECRRIVSGRLVRILSIPAPENPMLKQT